MSAHNLPPQQESLDGETLLALVSAGTLCLETHVDAINSLNVFPVPDGDTGINMLLTLRASLSALKEKTARSQRLDEVSSAIAQGALLGARGNSGVILSQFLAGFAKALQGYDVGDALSLKKALSAAAESGYGAVGTPVEGTMLTVMRAAAEEAESADNHILAVLRASLDSAQIALAQTPDQLPILKEAGVVDAGGQGIVAILTGMVAQMRGESPALEISSPEEFPDRTVVSAEFLEQTAEEEYGYCIQFLVRGSGLSLENMRTQIMSMAGSTVVIGTSELVRIHAHANDPQPLIDVAALSGTVDQLKVEDMDVMHQQFMAKHHQQKTIPPIAIISVANGNGLELIFSELGAAAVVRGGQSMNPSAADFIDAIDHVNAEHSIILPNNSNILMAAEQAASLSERVCTVIPTRSIPQGIAATLALNPDLDLDSNIAAMTNAMGTVQSGEVTIATRSANMADLVIREGQAIGLLEGDLICVSDNPEEAVQEVLAKSTLSEGDLVTLYWGSETTEGAADAVVGSVRSKWPGIEFEVVDGGQPHYHYLISIE